MIQDFVDKFMKAEEAVKQELKSKPPESYDDLVHRLVHVIGAEDEYRVPSTKRIHLINDGDYQGTLLFVIGAGDYQPSLYWAIPVEYGSCSGCDTLEAIRDEGPWKAKESTPEQVQQYWTLMLHMVQLMKEI